MGEICAILHNNDDSKGNIPLYCHSERGEESKVVAHTPFTDFSNCVELGLDYQWVLGLMERWASQDARSLSIALSMISNFRIHATSATLPHFPAALSRS